MAQRRAPPPPDRSSAPHPPQRRRETMGNGRDVGGLTPKVSVNIHGSVARQGGAHVFLSVLFVLSS